MGAPQLSFGIRPEDYQAIGEILYVACGIRLGDSKQNLVESRLSRRLQALGQTSLSEYVKHLKRNQKAEVPYLIEAMTTHKTEWFREAIHYDFLKSKIVVGASEPIYIWSAACATGEELWTIAMILKSLGLSAQDYRLLGSDISLEVVTKAEAGLYLSQGSQSPPRNIITEKFFSMRRDLNPPMLEIKKAFHESVKFKQMNLIRPNLPANLRFDFIFLRNVLIYFDPQSTQKVIDGLLKHLKPKGYLIIGLSENLRELSPKLKNLGRSIYQFE